MDPKSPETELPVQGFFMRMRRIKTDTAYLSETQKRKEVIDGDRI